MSDPTGEWRRGKLGGEEAEPDVDDMSVEELRAAVRQLREQRRRDLDTIESLRLPLLTELAGGGGAAVGEEAGAADVGEDEMTKHAAAVEGRLQETIEAVQEVTAGWDTGYGDDDEDWRCADYCVAGSCVLFNLLFGIMMASLAAAMLMSQHPSSPCRAGTAEGGWDVGGCARTLASALVTREPPPIAPTVCKHIGTALGPPALQLLQSGSLCASGEEGPPPPPPPPLRPRRPSRHANAVHARPAGRVPAVWAALVQHLAPPRHLARGGPLAGCPALGEPARGPGPGQAGRGGAADHRRGALDGVSRPFPSWNRSIVTKIYLCHACSCQEILRTETAGQGRGAPAATGQPADPAGGDGDDAAARV
eukprot:COSAG01_NODE_583_length_15194_cov_5.640808_5_plen_365_part_00